MRKSFLFMLLLLACGSAMAHPMPGTIVNLSVSENIISGEAKMPLLELESALGMPADNNIAVNTTFFANYFHRHIRALSGGKYWQTAISRIQMSGDYDPNVGDYKEVIVNFTLTPRNAADIRHFTFDYDAIVHQVVTHQVLVFVKQDWKNGIGADDNAQPIGVIKTDFVRGERLPLEVNLASGSWWKGFARMMNVGMDHIKEGTDHLLFLLVLLLPAMLVSNGKTWGSYGGLQYSFARLLKITTAFTVGHSLTLLIGAMEWLRLPSRPVEILIAVSILVSAIHAIKPLFPNKEVYVAGGFGLIHGLAFASVLSNMNLSTTTLALSVLAFNLGIELMQLFIICLIIPWLVLLSQTRVYKGFRFFGAAAAGVAALGWIWERSTGRANPVTTGIEKMYPYAIWLIIALAVTSLLIYCFPSFYPKRKWLFSPKR